jgi:hypothetical protein
LQKGEKKKFKRRSHTFEEEEKEYNARVFEEEHRETETACCDA